MMAEDFAAHAAKVKVSFPEERSPDEMRSGIEALLSKIALDCVEEGTRLIGHIKCIAEIEPERFLACSVVSHDGKPRCSGGFSRSSKNMDLVINVLQYGLGKEALARIVTKESLAAFGDGAVVQIEDLSKDESCERPKIISFD